VSLQWQKHLNSTAHALSRTAPREHNKQWDEVAFQESFFDDVRQMRQVFQVIYVLAETDVTR
jgi:hypothetical protein